MSAEKPDGGVGSGAASSGHICARLLPVKTINNVPCCPHVEPNAVGSLALPTGRGKGAGLALLSFGDVIKNEL